MSGQRATPRPPRPAQGLLRWLLPAEEREFFAGDLEEEFRERVAQQGAAAAKRWYWRQAISARALWRQRNVQQASEKRKGDGAMETWWQDARFALRMLVKNPGFTVVAVAVLALGIGANTAIFSVVHAVVLQRLGFPEPERLVMLWEKDEGGQPSNTGYLTFTDWRDQSRSLDYAAAMSYWNPTLSGTGEPVAVQGASVSGEYFRVLGVGPMLGRVLTPEDDRPNNRIAVISYGLWQRHFGGDPAVIGRPILLNGIERQVVGVMPRDFPSLLTHQGKPVEVWRPLAYRGEDPFACRTCRHLRAVARVRSGVPREQAEAELNTISQNMKRDHPTEYAETGAILQPLHEEFAGSARPVLLVLFGAVGFVLLVACANVANLLLARSAARRREWAVRVALGAGRARIVRQVLTENLLLALAGGAVGIALAYAGMQALIALSPGGLPRIEQAHLSMPVLLFALGASVLTGLLFGLAPALHASRLDPQEMLKEGGRGSAGRAHQRLRGLLVVADVALALVLLAGAGLMLKSIARLLDVNPGFTPDHVVTMNLSVFGPKYYADDGDTRVVATFTQIIEQVKALPGVSAAGASSMLPLGGNSDMYGIRVQDKPIANPAESPSAYRYGVTPGYLEAMRIPLRRGRMIEPRDTAAAQPVVVVNETFARRIWPGEDPIGKFVQMGEPTRPWRMVVGVVGDVRHAGLDEPDMMQFYAPDAQWMYAASDMTLAVRTSGDPLAVAAALRQAVWSVEKDVRISDVAAMQQVIHSSFGQRSFAATLLGLFAAVALLLAALGIYGVMAHAATQRTAEIGIRMALGAQPSDVLRLMLGHGMRLVLAGVVIGVAGALALTRTIQGLLFGVEATDPATLAAVSIGLGLVALLASWVPAWRAARIDPMVALRHE